MGPLGKPWPEDYKCGGGISHEDKGRLPKEHAHAPSNAGLHPEPAGYSKGNGWTRLMELDRTM